MRTTHGLKEMISTPSVSTEHDAPVCILMAAYNGAQFISQQIESIQHQSHENWLLLIRDDGSSDCTRSISQSFCETDNRIQLVESSTNRLGPCRNFEALIEVGLATRAEWFAFADQDDLWDPNKLSRHLESIRHIPLNTPHLVCSDLTIIDADGLELADSFLDYQALTSPDQSTMTKLLMQNSVVGASMFVNRTLLRFSLPFPHIYMHDWWLALLAKSHGQLTFMAGPLVKYRLHGNNACGAIGAGNPSVVLRILSISRIRKMLGLFLITFSQAECLLERLNTSLYATRSKSHSNTEEAIVNYLAVSEGTPLTRVVRYLSLPSQHDHFMSKLLWILCLLCPISILAKLIPSSTPGQLFSQPNEQQIPDPEN